MKSYILAAVILFNLPVFALDHNKAYDANINATCRVRADDGGTGSGLAIDKRHVLTAGHVVVGNKHATVEFIDPNTAEVYKRISAIVTKSIETGDANPFGNDLGLVTLEEDAPKFSPVKLGKAVFGEEGYIVGGPKAENPHVISVGVFSGRSVRVPVGILSAIGDHGSSGCPVFNSKGELVGVLVSGDSFCIYYITAERVEAFLKDVK